MEISLDVLWCDYCGLLESEYLQLKKNDRELKEGDCPGCRLLTPVHINQIPILDNI